MAAVQACREEPVESLARDVLDDPPGILGCDITVPGVPPPDDDIRPLQVAVSQALLRIIQWNKGLGPGVGLAPPETVGQRMAVMRTRDIVRLHDIFSDARASGEPWMVTEPVYDDLYDMTDKGPLNVIQRRVGVREMAVFGDSGMFSWLMLVLTPALVFAVGRSTASPIVRRRM